MLVKCKGCGGVHVVPDYALPPGVAIEDLDEHYWGQFWEHQAKLDVLWYGSMAMGWVLLAVFQNGLWAT